jgi:hypothetical protein
LRDGQAWFSKIKQRGLALARTGAAAAHRRPAHQGVVEFFKLLMSISWEVKDLGKALRLHVELSLNLAKYGSDEPTLYDLLLWVFSLIRVATLILFVHEGQIFNVAKLDISIVVYHDLAEIFSVVFNGVDSNRVEVLE